MDSIWSNPTRGEIDSEVGDAFRYSLGMFILQIAVTIGFCAYIAYIFAKYWEPGYLPYAILAAVVSLLIWVAIYQTYHDPRLYEVNDEQVKVTRFDGTRDSYSLSSIVVDPAGNLKEAIKVRDVNGNLLFRVWRFTERREELIRRLRREPRS
ncbi:MAG TPA: hypothetical protein VFS34_16335 [Thermoanaerobaculia bacterium]|nr:hypothetical protein [Thermoanaerobaculia bacterium]